MSMRKKIFVFVALLNALFSLSLKASEAKLVASETLDLSKQDSPEKKTVAVVGGGISGLLATKKLIDSGYNVVIFEKSDKLMGVWASYANDFSQLQVDGYLYSPVGEPSIVDHNASSGNVYSSREDILKYFSDYASRYGLEKFCQMKTEVTSWRKLENGNIEVHFKQEGVLKRAEVYSLWIRTGSLSRPKELYISGEEYFSGEVAYGVANDTRDIDFLGKRVVIVGMGATAMENARNAYNQGAESVTFIVRNRRFVLPRESFNEGVSSAFSLSSNLSDFFRRRAWKKSMDISRSHHEAAGLASYYQSTTFQKDGYDHLPCTALGHISDEFFSYFKEGFLKIEDGEVLALMGDSVTFQKARGAMKSISADIFLKCLGYDTDKNLIQGHSFAEALFESETGGRVNHNLGIDSLLKEKIFGATQEVNVYPLISYPLFSEIFDTLCIKALSSGETAMKARWNRMGEDFVPAEEIDVSHYIDTFWSIIQMKQDWRTLWSVGLSFWKARERQLDTKNQKSIRRNLSRL